MKNFPPEYWAGFDPTKPDSPATGDGLPILRSTVYDCIEACGDDLAAGVLLFKMMFLCRRSTITIKGMRWYVRRRESLCRETRLTRHQYDRALKALKTRGYVETRAIPFSLLHIFGHGTMFRVTLAAVEDLKKVLNLRGPVAAKKE